MDLNDESKKLEVEGSYGYFTILAVKFTSSEQQIERYCTATSSKELQHFGQVLQWEGVELAGKHGKHSANQGGLRSNKEWVSSRGLHV